MVDPGDEVVELPRVAAEHGGELAGGVLDGVAQANRADPTRLGDGPAQHRHRVDVLQEQGARAQLLHVATDAEQHRDRPQAAHDPSDTERVGDRLTNSVAVGDDEIDHRRGIQPTDLEAGDYVVGAIERLASIGDGVHLDARPARIGEPARHHLGRRQTLAVDVHQRERGPVRQRGKAQQIADQVPREDGRARSDDGDLRSHPAGPLKISARR